MKKFTKIAGLLSASAVALAGCSSDADTVNENLSKDADNFKVMRKITFVNGITDKYLLTIEGSCSIKDDNKQLEVICKTDGGYKKHFLGLSDNVTYFAEQVQANNVSPNHYKIVFKPEQVLPNLEVRGSKGEAKTNMK